MEQKEYDNMIDGLAYTRQRLVDEDDTSGAIILIDQSIAQLISNKNSLMKPKEPRIRDQYICIMEDGDTFTLHTGEFARDFFNRRTDCVRVMKVCGRVSDPLVVTLRGCTR